MRNILKIGLWNARSVNNKIDEIKEIIHEYDILCITETWSMNLDLWNIKNYRIIHDSMVRKQIYNNTYKAGTGIAIIHRTEINITLEKIIYLTNDFEALKCNVKDQDNIERAKLIVFYRNHNHDITETKWLKMLKTLDINDNTILLGDFNAKNTTWNCAINDKTGISLELALEIMDLTVVNDFTKSRRGGKYRSSNIDLLILKEKLIDQFECKESLMDLGSDHQIIDIYWHTEYRINPRNVSNIKEYKSYRIYNQKKMNWSIFREHLTNKQMQITKEINSTNDLNEKYNRWKDSIRKTFTEIQSKPTNKARTYKQYNTKKNLNNTVETSTINVYKKNKNKTKNRWWDNECKELWDNWKKATKQLWNSGNIEDYNTMTGYHEQWKKLKKKKKQEKWDNLIEEISKEQDMTKVWNKIKYIKEHFTKEKNIIENKIRTELEDTEIKRLKEINTKELPVFEIPATYRTYKNLPENDKYNTKINNAEILQTIESCKNKKSAPGIDNIDYTTISELPPFLKKILAEIITTSWETTKIPEDWKKGALCLLDKPGKKALRPITLTSCTGKIIEKIINNRLQLWIEENQIIDKTQAGFRKDKSTMDNLYWLHAELKENIRNGDTTLATFVDIKGAYDSVDLNKLIQIMKEKKCPKKIVKWINNWLTGRNIEITDNRGVLHMIPWRRGVPQGAILSPTLFNIYITGISELITNPNTFTIQYADDVAIITKSPKIEEAKNELTSAFQKLTKFLKERKLEISASKTQMIRVDNKNKYTQTSCNITTGNNVFTIKSEKEAKFLGVIFDYNLSFIPHIKHVINKAKKRVKAIKYLCNGQKGIRQDQAINITKALVSSVIEYAAPIYLSSNLNETYRQKIRKIESAALRAAIGYRVTTPINVIYADNGFTGIHFRAKLLANRYWIKQMEKGLENGITLGKQMLTYTKLTDLQLVRAAWKTKKSSPNLGEEIFHQAIEIGKDIVTRDKNKERLEFWEKKCSKVQQNSERYNQEIIIDTKTGRDIEENRVPPSATTKYFLDKYNLTREDTSIYYTDGSKIPDSLSNGLAIVEEEKEIFKKEGIAVNNLMTIYTTEAIAIHEAMERATNVNEKNNILILTDSMSVLLALENKINNLKEINKKDNIWINKIANLIELTSNTNKTILAWIPGHRGIPGNEIADSIAKEYTKNPHNRRYGTPMCDLLLKIKEDNWEEFATEMERTGNSKGVLYFNTLWKKKKETKFKPWFEKFKKILNRKEIRTLARLRANHFNLKESLARVNIIESSGCDCGNGEESINHVVFDCSLYNSQRISLYDKIGEEMNKANKDILNLLLTDKLKIYRQICKFLEACNINI